LGEKDSGVPLPGKKLCGKSIFGEITVEERAFIRAGRLVRPFSEVAGVHCRGYLIPLQRHITDFGAEKSFPQATRQLKEHYGLEVPESAVRSYHA